MQYGVLSVDAVSGRTEEGARGSATEDIRLRRGFEEICGVRLEVSWSCEGRGMGDLPVRTDLLAHTQSSQESTHFKLLDLKRTLIVPHVLFEERHELVER